MLLRVWGGTRCDDEEKLGTVRSNYNMPSRRFVSLALHVGGKFSFLGVFSFMARRRRLVAEKRANGLLACAFLRDDRSTPSCKLLSLAGASFVFR